MKKSLSILFAVLAFAACSRKVDFTEIPFVYFYNNSMSVYEDTSVVCIPVYANAEGEFAVTFEAIDGEKKDLTTGQMVPNGKNGEDYSIVDNDAAILRFKTGHMTDTIKVQITDRPGVLTGNKDFTLKLLSVSGGEVSLGGFSTCKVTIIDNDHPLKSILGAYNATGVDYFDDSDLTWTMTLVADPNDYYKVWIDGITPNFAGDYLSGAEGKNHAVYATFKKNADLSADLGSFTIAGGQKLADPYQGYDIIIMNFSGTSVSESAITFTQNSEGTGYSASSGLGANISGTMSFFELIYPGITIIKK